jgi:hypothetical protein
MSSTFTLVTPAGEATYATTKAIREAIIDYLNDHYADRPVHVRLTLEAQPGYQPVSIR